MQRNLTVREIEIAFLSYSTILGHGKNHTYTWSQILLLYFLCFTQAHRFVSVWIILHRPKLMNNYGIKCRLSKLCHLMVLDTLFIKLPVK